MDILSILFAKEHLPVTIFVTVLIAVFTSSGIMLSKYKGHADYIKAMFNPSSGISSSRIFAAIDLGVIVMLSFVFSLVMLLGIKIETNAVTIVQAIFGALVTIFGICVGGATVSKFSATEKASEVPPTKHEEPKS
jgi:uncharacterized membrane protein